MLPPFTSQHPRPAPLPPSARIMGGGPGLGQLAALAPSHPETPSTGLVLAWSRQKGKFTQMCGRGMGPLVEGPNSHL